MSTAVNVDSASTQRNGAKLAHWVSWASLKAAFWVGLALCLSVALTPHPPKIAVQFGDLVAHLAAFSYLTVALFAAHFPSNVGGPAGDAPYRMLAVALWMLAVGVLIEVGQLFVAGRSSEFADLGVDAAGIALGCAAYWVWDAYKLRSAPVGRGEAQIRSREAE